MKGNSLAVLERLLEDLLIHSLGSQSLDDADALERIENELILVERQDAGAQIPREVEDQQLRVDFQQIRQMQLFGVIDEIGQEFGWEAGKARIRSF